MRGRAGLLLAVATSVMLAASAVAGGEKPPAGGAGGAAQGWTLSRTVEQIAVGLGFADADVLGDTGLTAAVAAAGRLSEAGKTPVLALDLTPEGHFTFATVTGETYTAGTPAELGRVAAVLLPGVVAGLRDAHVVMSTASLFAGVDALRKLPQTAALSVVISGHALPAQRRPGGRIGVAISPALSLSVDDSTQLAEALRQLRRPIPAGRVGLLSGRDAAELAAIGRTAANAAVSSVALIPADAARLTEAIGDWPRRMLLVTGKLAGGQLVMDLPSGRAARMPFAELDAAATAADVDLVLLETDPPRQPGGRTWLYRPVTIANTDQAAYGVTFQDMLGPLAEARGGFDVRLQFDPGGAVRLTAQPRAAGAGVIDGFTGTAADLADNVRGEVSGALKPRAVSATLVPHSRRRELASRLIPGVPAALQWVYLAVVVVGALGWRTARVWWRRLWPVERRGDYPSAIGHLLARGVRSAAFIAIFLPIAGPTAAVAGMIARRRRTHIPR